MKKAIPYIYIIVGFSFVIKGFYAFFNEQEIYYLIFSLKTESKSIYILFNLFFGGLILYSGIGRLKSFKK
ncbi:hypothetical protein KCTC32516_02223 [Polaribacter huanghezhanensis]|uniref:hypothetical protein n=1 Tax=Polaribacter huanghezhanensis TaxID=1354726 RepID=UPI0026496427|nr:hypothetical protein [Polaribacter huanghezhanensis]WKD86843.1 hypothetical protein KCTC32516_02223 [Polaribacter huanghezhanensis]